MVRYRISRVGEDVVITRTEGAAEDLIRFPHRIFLEIVEEIKEYPDAEDYPIQLEVPSGTMEIPYTEFFRLASALAAN